MSNPPLPATVELIERLSAHADRIIGSSGRRFWRLEHIPSAGKFGYGMYQRRRVYRIPGCAYMLVYESALVGPMLHYSLGGEYYLSPRNL